MRTFLAIQLCFLFICSCAKKEDPEDTYPERTMTGILADTSFTADNFSSSYSTIPIMISGCETKSNRYITLYLNNSELGAHTMTVDSNGSRAICRETGSIWYSTINGAADGSITVTSNSDNKLSGTFSFTGYTFNGLDSAVVSGQFTNFAF